MDNDGGFQRFIHQENLNSANRPLRLKLAQSEGLPDGALLPQRISGSEAIFDGFEYRVSCVSTISNLPLKQLIALPVEIQLVTDSGELRRVCGIVTEALSGGCDGGISAYQIVVRDAMTIMEKRTNVRIFRNMSELDILEIIFAEWQASCWTMNIAFNYEFDAMFKLQPLPKHDFVMQYNESDAAFVRRLLKRRGIGWYFRPGPSIHSKAEQNPDEQLVHTLVVFFRSNLLPLNAAGTVRYHRADSTEQRDTITALSAHRTLQAGTVKRHAWNFLHPRGLDFMNKGAASASNQGPHGNALAASLEDYQVDIPFAGGESPGVEHPRDTHMRRYDLATKCFYGEGPLRDFCAGTYFSLVDHPEIDQHPAEEREFVIVALQITALNNLPKDLTERAERLFSHSRWNLATSSSHQAAAVSEASAPGRVHVQFTAVRRTIDIVPAFDPRVDLPHPEIQSAIVVGPEGEEVYCNELGQVKVRFTGTRVDDHKHSSGAGASNRPGDSAWIRVATNWAGNESSCGTVGLPRVGAEVLVAFLGGDPDKPIIICQLFNASALPPPLKKQGSLPRNRYLSGIRSHEVNGPRGNQLRFDDTTGRISAQLASDHGASELNLGLLAAPNGSNANDVQRGEGAELRSDLAVAVRGDQGVLISAEGSSEGEGAQLGRAGLVGLAEVLHSVAGELATLAATHAGDEAAAPHLANLVGKLKQWHGGAQEARRAIVAVSAPAGMVLGSQANLALGAETRVDILCAGDTELATGKTLFMRAASSISMFAYKLGIKLIAARGNVVIESHDGNVQIKSSRRISLNAAEGIDLMAPEIKVVSQGAQTDWGGGKITQHSTGTHMVKSSDVQFVGPGGGAPPGLEFSDTELKTDERVVVRDRHTLLPMKGRRYTARHDDGTTSEGITDDHGRTHIVTNAAMGEVDITLHEDMGAASPTTGSTA